LILNIGADVNITDNTGRSLLHWAAFSGQVDVVEGVISLLKGFVDQADIDGWTPLLWAARGCNGQKELTPNAHEQIIKLLLDRGADPCVRGKGLSREWSPVEVARFHGADESVVQFLRDKAAERLDSREDANVPNEESRMGHRKPSGCDVFFFL
jgi:ankyrin repeat protein